MDNTTTPNTTIPQITRDSDDAGTSDVGNSILAGILAAVFLCFLFVAAGIALIYKRRRASFTAATNTGTQPKTDALEEDELGHSKSKNTERADDLDDTERGVDPTPTESLQTASSEEPAAGSRRSRILDPEKTMEKAKFFFPGYLKHTTLSLLKAKYMNRRWGRVTDANVAIRLELEKKFYEQIRNLEYSEGDKTKMEEWERLNRRENAADFCKAVGMNPDVVDLRFQLIKSLEKALPFPIHKSHIVISIEHVIDTIHVANPFGEGTEFDGEIRHHYRGKDWLSYLGVHFGKDKSKIHSEVEYVQHEMEKASSRNGFFAHGTTAAVLEEIMESGEDGLLPSEHRKGNYQDFGPGIYTFKKKISWALSFAIDRCWPVSPDKETNKPVIKSCNPAIVVFPKADHTILNNDQKTREIVGEAIDEKALKQLKLRLKDDANYNMFVSCRKKWENNKDLGYWKDFTWLSLFTGKLLLPKGGFDVLYGPMEEGKVKVRGEEPIVDEDGWVQYCFRDEEVLGREQIFVEFNIDWKDWYEQREDATLAEVEDNIAEVKKDIEKVVLAKE